MKEPSDDERLIMDEGNLKAVLRATGRPLRDAQEVLEENGIPWSVVYEGEEQGYRLFVPAERGEEAMRVLAATESQLSPFVGWYHQKHSGERTCRGCGAQFRV